MQKVQKFFSGGKGKIILISAEVLVLIALLAAVVLKSFRLKEIPIRFTEMQSDFMHFDGDAYLMTEDDYPVDPKDEKAEAPEVILSGRFSPLKAGSYTLSVNYDAELQQTCQVYSPSSNVYVRAEKFNLSRNRNTVDYRFYVSRDIDDLLVRFTNYSGGDYSVQGVSLKENANHERILLLLWILLCGIIDYVLFSRNYQKNRDTVFAVLGLAFSTSLLLFMFGLYLGHDYQFHLARIEGISLGLKSGQFPVRMYPFFNDNYGYPVGIFYGDLLLYFPALLRLIGFTVLTSYKLYIFFVNILTALSSYLCAKHIFRNSRTAFIVSLSYMTAGYRLVDIYVRTAIGEYTSFVFFPLIFLGMWNLYTQDPEEVSYQKNAIPLAVGMAGLIYSHILSTEMALEVLLVAALVFFRKTFRKQTFLALMKSVGLCTALSLAFIIPFVEYYRTTHVEITNQANSVSRIQRYGAYFSDYFAVFRDGFGTAWGNVTERLLVSPGLILMAALVVAYVLLVRKKATIEIRAVTILSTVLLWVASDLFPWNWLAESSKVGNLMASIQFPWRFVGFAVMSLSILLGLVTDRMIDLKIWDIKVTYLIIAGCCFGTCMFMSNFVDNAPQSYFVDNPELAQYTDNKSGVSVLGASEYMLPGTETSQLDYEVTGDHASGLIEAENGVDLTLRVESEDGSTLEIPRFCYPFFRVIDENGLAYETEPGTNNKIKVFFPHAYQGRLFVQYRIPWYWILSDFITGLSVVVFLIYLARPNLIKRAV